MVYITWSAVTPDGIRALEHFLCLSLRTLELRCSKESRADDLISVIQKLPQACPGLVTLRLSYVQHWDAVDTQERLVSALQKVLPEMTSLRFFQGTEFLITLGILPVLARSKSLCFNGDHGVMHEFDSASFPMLHEVNITGNADICTKFMAAFSPVNRIRVSKLHADLHDDRLDDSTARLFLRAIQSVLSDSLLELEIISDWPFKSECLDSLFGCHHLVALVIPILFDNGDADGSLFTARATRAWPNLVRHDFSYLHTYLAELVLLGPVLFPI